MTYQGIPEPLRQEVLTRDCFRCRWCGATNQGGDLHHIQYRRGYSYDRLDNLVTLCRPHHSFVHGIPNGAGQTITKKVAQRVLQDVISKPGVTGSSVWRALKRQWAAEGSCEKHGEPKNTCLDCPIRAVDSTPQENP